MFAKWKKSRKVSDRAHLDEDQTEIQKSLKVKLAIYEDKQKRRAELAAKANKEVKVNIADFNSGPVEYNGMTVEELPTDSQRTASKVKKASSAWNNVIGRDKTIAEKEDDQPRYEQKYG